MFRTKSHPFEMPFEKLLLATNDCKRLAESASCRDTRNVLRNLSQQTMFMARSKDIVFVIRSLDSEIRKRPIGPLDHPLDRLQLQCSLSLNFKSLFLADSRLTRRSRMTIQIRWSYRMCDTRQHACCCSVDKTCLTRSLNVRLIHQLIGWSSATELHSKFESVPHALISVIVENSPFF